MQLRPRLCAKIVLGLFHEGQVFYFTLPELDIALDEDLDLRTCKLSQVLAPGLVFNMLFFVSEILRNEEELPRGYTSTKELFKSREKCCIGRLDATFLNLLFHAAGPPAVRRRKLFEFLDADQNVTLPLFLQRGNIHLWQRVYEGHSCIPCFEEADGIRVECADRTALEAFQLLLATTRHRM